MAARTSSASALMWFSACSGICHMATPPTCTAPPPTAVHGSTWWKACSMAILLPRRNLSCTRTTLPPRTSPAPPAETLSAGACRPASVASRVELPGSPQAADELASSSARARATARSPPTPKRPRRLPKGEDTSEAATSAAASNMASISRSSSSFSSDAAAAAAAAASLAARNSAMAKPTRAAKVVRFPGGEGRDSGDDCRGGESS